MVLLFNKKFKKYKTYVSIIVYILYITKVQKYKSTKLQFFCYVCVVPYRCLMSPNFKYQNNHTVFNLLCGCVWE